jgi:hypothetical protein
VGQFTRLTAAEISAERLPKLFFLDLDDEAKAIKLAREIAAKTGSAVTVRRSDGTKIETVVPTKH